jgi:hypothetical protein
MLTITNIDELQNKGVAHNGSNWMVTKININDENDYYGIVIRKQPDTAGEYVVLYLFRDSVGDGEYEIHSNKSSTKRVVHISDIKSLYKFLLLIQKEISRLC